MPPKFRLFAGPNGSGKTSLFDHLRNNGFINTELYINADRYERELKENSRFNFNAYRVKVSQKDFLHHITTSSLYHEKFNDKDLITDLSIEAGILHFNIPKDKINSYHASFISSYLVEKLFETSQSFCFETVMSHESKLNLLNIAKNNGFKTYLYFVYTDNPELNVARVKLRALMGLHNVDPDKIRSRYLRSFQLLSKALKIADEAYLINNSDKFIITAERRNDSLILKAPILDELKQFIL
jgi:predicted ABC-type ATPase